MDAWASVSFAVLLFVTIFVWLLYKLEQERRAEATARRKLASTSFNLIELLERQWEFSQRTFGPSPRAGRVLDHIRKELEEVEASPEDPIEWADVLLLAFDGAMRAGHTPQTICDALSTKFSINEQRDWPDWRTADPSKPIEHIRPNEA